MDENLIDLEILTVKDQAYRIKDGALTKRVEQLEQNAGAGGSGGGGTQGAQGPQGEKGDKGDKGDPGTNGADGKSAYQIWLDAGNQGTETDFLNAIKGAKGDKGDKGDSGNDGANGTNGAPGADGKSAYEIWLDAGNQGTETDFLNSLKGAKGDKGDPGNDGAPGTNGTNGTNGADGADGKSAYQIWLDAGNQGTQSDFLNSLKGAKGNKGDKGDTGTDGADGAPGKSAYQIWLDAGNQGTETDFLNAIKGEKGDKGEPGEQNNVMTGKYLKQVDLATYDGPIGEIVQHIGDDLDDLLAFEDDYTKKIKHTFVYKRVDDRADRMTEKGLYVYTINWNDDRNSPRTGELYGSYPDPSQFLAEHPLPYKIVGMKQVYGFGFDNQRVYADRAIALTPRVNVGDQILVGGDARWRISTVTSANSTEFDTDYPYSHVAGNAHQPTINTGTIYYIPVYEDADGNRFLTPYIKRTSNSIAEFKDYVDNTWNGNYSTSYASVITEDLQTVLLQNVFVRLVDTDVRSNQIYPKWERVNMQPRHNFTVCLLDADARERIVDTIFPTRLNNHVLRAIDSWAGGQYDPIHIDTIIDYYRCCLNDVETEDYPYLIAVNNAGVTVNEEPLYVKTTAKDVTVITVIPYGYSGIFTRAKGDNEYFPLAAANSSTITEYELSELAAQNAGNGDSFGS